MGLKSSKICELDLKNIINIPEKDRQTLKTLGFDVKAMIGSGEFGSVYKGVYGMVAGGMRDFEGNLMNVSPNQEFAVKYINVKGLEEFELSRGRVDLFEKVDRFVEREKQNRHQLVDSTLVGLRICLNLGHFRPVILNTRTIIATDLDQVMIRPSYDRIYLVMDWTKFGNLDQYLQNLDSKGQKVKQNVAILWMQRLLSAVKYLQDNDVFRINLKPNNILMFEEVVKQDMFDQKVIVPKLSDFMSYDYFNEEWDIEKEDPESESEDNDDEVPDVPSDRKKKAKDTPAEEESDTSEESELESDEEGTESNKEQKEPEVNKKDGSKEIESKDSEEESDSDSDEDEEKISYSSEQNLSKESIKEEESSCDSEDIEESIDSNKLSERNDIFELANILEKIVVKTQFDSESVRHLADDMIRSMRDCSAEDCGCLLSNDLFEI